MFKSCSLLYFDTISLHGLLNDNWNLTLKTESTSCISMGDTLYNIQCNSKYK